LIFTAEVAIKSLCPQKIRCQARIREYEEYGGGCL
jgi:hypothetical protein